MSEEKNQINILESSNKALSDNQITRDEDFDKYHFFEDDEQIKLIIKYQQQHDIEARNKIIESNLGLCKYIAQKTISKYTNLEFDELVQEYSLVLLEAIEHYDVTSGYKFSTYAAKGMINKSCRLKTYQDDLVIAKQRNTKAYREFIKYKKEYIKKYNRVPQREEIIKELNISDELYKRLVQTENHSIQSLNQKIKDKDGDKSTELIDFITEDKNEYENIDEFIDQQLLLKTLMNNLTPENYYIAYYRFIAKKDNKKTQDEIANEFDCSRNTINAKEAQVAYIIRNGILYNIKKLEREILKQYSVKEIEQLDVIPLSPSTITVLHSLRSQLPEMNYEILYNMIKGNRNNNLEYYCKKYLSVNRENLMQQIQDIVRIKNEYFVDEMVNKIFEEYKIRYSIIEIFDLDIRPKENTEAYGGQRKNKIKHD